MMSTLLIAFCHVFRRSAFGLRDFEQNRGVSAQDQQEYRSVVSRDERRGADRFRLPIETIRIADLRAQQTLASRETYIFSLARANNNVLARSDAGREDI